MTRILFAIATLALVAGCNTFTDRKEITLLQGFRDPGDACRVVAENAFTNQYIGDDSILVACPTGGENIGVFVEETRGRAVDQVGAYTLYLVPTI